MWSVWTSRIMKIYEVVGAVRGPEIAVAIGSFTLAIYLLFLWIVSSKVLLVNYLLICQNEEIPRVYLSDTNWFERSIDCFRTISGGFDIVLKGYKRVLPFMDFD